MSPESYPRRPGIGETIIAAGGLVHSYPVLLASWLVLSLAGVIVLNLVTSPGPLLGLRLLAFIPYGLAAIFFLAGYMGSLHLLLKLGGWSPIAVFECGRHYFSRFFLLGLIKGLVIVLPAIALGFLVAVATPHLSRVLTLPVIFAFAFVAVGQLVFLVFLAFAPVGVVAGERRVMAAIGYSFRMVRSNFLPALVFILLFSGLPALCSYLVARIYRGSPAWLGLLPGTLLTAYGHLLLMAALVYFAVEIGKAPKTEL